MYRLQREILADSSHRFDKSDNENYADSRSLPNLLGEPTGSRSFSEMNHIEKELVRELSRDISKITLRDPSTLFHISPRQFEILILNLLTSRGYDVRLTSMGNDGGRDLIIDINRELGRHRILVELKRYSPGRPVSVEIIRQFYGVIEAQGCTAGVIFSTSGFTKGANSFADLVCHRVSLKTFADLLKLLCDEYRAAGERVSAVRGLTK